MSLPVAVLAGGRALRLPFLQKLADRSVVASDGALEDRDAVSGAAEGERGPEATDSSTDHDDVLGHPDPPWQRALPSR